ncbi:hypothetical protein BLNAU_6449 [Blattamonas nauphoetae]|uniref:Ubiquitin-like domain-containing protein n=1 Tax=Blattamonas nauphoetae TaxID=2049346 RepID=A0ABQ9Y4L6_9EUKA|nr:hypothetical protein BLNAU_6449 [Blattamonas nauphoetae]
MKILSDGKQLQDSSTLISLGITEATQLLLVAKPRKKTQQNPPQSQIPKENSPHPPTPSPQAPLTIRQPILKNSEKDASQEAFNTPIQPPPVSAETAMPMAPRKNEQKPEVVPINDPFHLLRNHSQLKEIQGLIELDETNLVHITRGIAANHPSLVPAMKSQPLDFLSIVTGKPVDTFTPFVESMNHPHMFDFGDSDTDDDEQTHVDDLLDAFLPVDTHTHSVYRDSPETHTPSFNPAPRQMSPETEQPAMLRDEAVDIHLNQQDEINIRQIIENTSVTHDEALEAYLACEKNVSHAINFLLDSRFG